ncbi:BamA/TamA family outer membrane protein [Flavobacterium caeni]|uniref:hypothetical protein n=1 Tax=Flavobacterium caeni TaxID=490189 RepID=UPI001FCDBEF6|nr:hypothetical protein [Flavobacterium caeni]
MKNWFGLVLLLLLGSPLSAQTLRLKINGASDAETKTIDSIGYNPQHTNAKSITDEVRTVSQKLARAGFVTHEILGNEKPTDSTFLFRFALGSVTKTLHLYIGTVPELRTIAFPSETNDTLAMPYTEVENFLNATLSRLEKKGYAMAKLQLTDLSDRQGSLHANLKLTLNAPRQVNDIVINGYTKFPEGHKRQIKRMYRNRTFNQETLQQLRTDFDKFRFVKQIKHPEILFETDSTKIYVYLEKNKANTFDGFIGFSNGDDNKVRFNGYVDLILNNILNTGETFTIYWKSDGNDQKTFNAAIELPYIFKSPFALKGNLNIFKQDSTFQNTRTALDLGYFFNYNTRLYLGYQSTESSDIQNVNLSSLSDFTSTFFTTHFEFMDFKPDDFLFPEKTRLYAKAGLGSRESKFEKNGQFFAQLELKHNFYLNEKNLFHLKTQNFLLDSDKYIVNELHRFGGINSIRGFNENSLQGNLFTSLLTEYRYVLTPGIYAHTIIDYGYFRDDSSDNGGSLLGLGFGFGLLTKTGLFNIVYANGSTNDQAIKLSNSIVHISFKTSF